MEKTSKGLLFWVVVSSFLLSANQAFAYFKIAKNHTPASSVSSKIQTAELANNGPKVLIPARSIFDDSRVAQVGNKPILENIVSKGSDLPLKVALQMLLPSPQWVLHEGVSDPDILNQKITWDHHGTWVAGLDEIGQMQNLKFLINWTTRSVYVSNVSRPKSRNVLSEATTPDRFSSEHQHTPLSSTPAQKNINKIHGQIDRVVDNKAFKRKEADGPSPKKKQIVSTKAKIWMLKKGSLKKQLGDWCQKSGYQLNWLSSYDWMIDTSAEFSGDFPHVVESLVKELYSQNTGITAELYMGNQVLVIKGE